VSGFLSRRFDHLTTISGVAPIVSVVIPVRNRASLVRRALDSVFAQTLRRFEVIVVDDGSTDDTPEVVAAYPQPVRLIRCAPTGVSAARNLGIARARGEFVAFLDSDDWFEPTKLERQVGYFALHPDVGMVYTRYSVFDEQTGTQWVHPGGLTAQGDAFRDLMMGFMETPLTTPTVMVRRSVFEVVEPFDTSMDMAEDIDLWCRIARRYNLGFIDEPLSVIRIHKGNTSGRTTPEENLEIWTAIARKNVAGPDPRLDQVFRRRVWAKIYWTVAEHRRARGGATMNWHHMKSLASWPSLERVRAVKDLMREVVRR